MVRAAFLLTFFLNKLSEHRLRLNDPPSKVNPMQNLKLEYILYKDAQIRIWGFGIAEKLDLIYSNHFKGSILYVAPEIFQTQNFDFKIDVWSLGVILCKAPFC